jgi:signal transduction histidine kinase/low affinity Fe/Cu permease
MERIDGKPLVTTPQWHFTIQNVWDSLTHPHASITAKDEQRQARLLATMLFVVVVLGGLFLVYIGLTRPGSRDDLDFQLYVAGTLVLAVGYGLSRTPRYRVAAVIFIVLLFAVFVFVPFTPGAQNQILAFTVLATLVTGLFFSLRWVMVISAAEMVVIPILIQTTSYVDTFAYTVMFQFVILADAMIITFIHHLSSIERERRAELENMNDQLRESEASLERRVKERTRDLTVASDVSRRTTTVLDMATLLPQLTRLTQQGFDLYGVSVYLFDAAAGVLRRAADATTSGLSRPHETDNAIRVDDANGIIPLAARSLDAVVINDTAQSDRFRVDAALPDTRAEMVVPLLVGKSLVGVLDLQSKQVNRFSTEDQYILTTLAEQVAIAVRNAQLFQEAETARREAETANETKSRFLANMSHELRTPLNAILNFSAFVADGVLGPVNEEQAEVLNESIASGKHLLSLINDVLDITKIEAGMMELFIEEVDLNTVISSAVSVAKGLVKDKPVSLLTTIDEGLPSTFGDKRRLRQVFLNIISNAAKFTTSGEIEISAQRWESGVEVRVRDTGMGIPADEQHKVFEAFKQAKHELAGAPGTGLGMPITRYFVEMHGGQIWFESQPGEGTTFYVRLPHMTQTSAEHMNQQIAEAI